MPSTAKLTRQRGNRPRLTLRPLPQLRRGHTYQLFSKEFNRRLPGITFTVSGVSLTHVWVTSDGGTVSTLPIPTFLQYLRRHILEDQIN